jgi:MYXO-CTERM domain-containing protein
MLRQPRRRVQDVFRSHAGAVRIVRFGRPSAAFRRRSCEHRDHEGDMDPAGVVIALAAMIAVELALRRRRRRSRDSRGGSGV